jgi:sterol desaturase/sphingolipid hydroxylase (fatty acid hydroxylase superfamily)
VQAGQLARELLGNALFILIFAAAMTLAFTSGRIEPAAFSAAGFTITFFGAMISFDLYYYALHFAMHTRVLAPIHDWHHRSRVNTPWSALSMAPAEAALWLVGLALWPLVTAGGLPFVWEGYLAWLAFFWVSNTMGHINVEIVPAGVSASRWTSWMSHAITYHALHHARFQKHYCFFLNSLDMAFGQVWPDYPEMHARVARGEPMSRLGERGATALPRGERP